MKQEASRCLCLVPETSSTIPGPLWQGLSPPLTRVTTLSYLQSLVHLCIQPVEGAQTPIKLLSGASLNCVKDHSPLQSQDSESCMRRPLFSSCAQHLHYHTDKQERDLCLKSVSRRLYLGGIQVAAHTSFMPPHSLSSRKSLFTGPATQVLSTGTLAYYGVSGLRNRHLVRTLFPVFSQELCLLAIVFCLHRRELRLPASESVCLRSLPHILSTSPCSFRTPEGDTVT